MWAGALESGSCWRYFLSARFSNASLARPSFNEIGLAWPVPSPAVHSLAQLGLDRDLFVPLRSVRVRLLFPVDGHEAEQFSNLRFADDVPLVADQPEQAKRMLTDLMGVAPSRLASLFRSDLFFNECF